MEDFIVPQTRRYLEKFFRAKKSIYCKIILKLNSQKSL